MNATQVLDILEARHDPREWVFFRELRLGTGYGGKWEQRIDAWAINCYPSRGLQRVSYEIKVSRADFLSELKHPKKRDAAMEMSNLFYFVALPGVVKNSEQEIPSDCGYILVDDAFDPRHRYTRVIEAPYRDCSSPPWRFVASLARRVRGAEEEK